MPFNWAYPADSALSYTFLQRVLCESTHFSNEFRANPHISPTSFVITCGFFFVFGGIFFRHIPFRIPPSVAVSGLHRTKKLRQFTGRSIWLAIRSAKAGAGVYNSWDVLTLLPPYVRSHTLSCGRYRSGSPANPAHDPLPLP